MYDRYLATATLTGHLALLNRSTLQFVIPTEPQFPLGEPIERHDDPVLYETENTRPISALAFLENGDLMFAEGAGLRRVDPNTGKIIFLSHCPIDLVWQTAPKDCSKCSSSTMVTTRLRCIAKTNLTPKTIPRATFAPDGRNLLVACFDSAPDLWRPSFQLVGKSEFSWLW